MSVVEELEAVSEENAAITVLPAADGQAKILLESEDHSKMGEFIIHLEQESTGSADDDSMDYPVKDMKVTVGNEYGTDKKENALDNNYGTLWHTDWHNVTPVEKRWIQLELDKETNIDALRYYSRNDGANGRVNKYKVEVTLVKRADITYAQEVRNYDDELDVSIDENNLIIKSINGKKILKQNITGKLSIVVTNENDVIKIGLKQTEDESEVPISFYNEVKSIIVDGKKPGNIRFNLLNQDTPVNINFIIQNNIDSEFNLCISRSKGTKFTSDEKITKESKGSVIITKQEFTPDEMGDIYDLNVTVKRDGEVLFEGNGYKNINFK